MSHPTRATSPSSVPQASVAATRDSAVQVGINLDRARGGVGPVTRWISAILAAPNWQVHTVWMCAKVRSLSSSRTQIVLRLIFKEASYGCTSDSSGIKSS
jgi:hypothetical protein